jgi:hypothetical protein
VTDSTHDLQTYMLFCGSPVESYLRPSPRAGIKGGSMVLLSLQSRASLDLGRSKVDRPKLSPCPHETWNVFSY